MATPTHVTRFQLANGDIIWAEVTPTDADTAIDAAQPKRASRGHDDELPQFEKAIATIRPAANAVFATLQEMNTPDSIELEFGITLSGEVGAIFASAKTDANFKVKLAWKNEKPTRSPTATAEPSPSPSPSDPAAGQ